MKFAFRSPRHSIAEFRLNVHTPGVIHQCHTKMPHWHIPRDTPSFSCPSPHGCPACLVSILSPFSLRLNMTRSLMKMLCVMYSLKHVASDADFLQAHLCKIFWSGKTAHNSLQIMMSCQQSVPSEVSPLQPAHGYCRFLLVWPWSSVIGLVVLGQDLK